MYTPNSEHSEYLFGCAVFISICRNGHVILETNYYGLYVCGVCKNVTDWCKISPKAFFHRFCSIKWTYYSVAMISMGPTVCKLRHTELSWGLLLTVTLSRRFWEPEQQNDGGLIQFNFEFVCFLPIALLTEIILVNMQKTGYIEAGTNFMELISCLLEVCC